MLNLKSVRDEDLLRELSQLVKQSRGGEAEVVAHVGEVELRRLYAQTACSSMFEYCRSILGLRENEAYLRITVARAAREHPVLLEMLRDGRLHLSGIARLAPHLTRQNADAVLKRACGKSHREIRELVAELEPRPDVAPSVRKLPQRPTPSSGGAALHLGTLQLGAPRVESDTINIASDAVRPESDAAKLGADAAKHRSDELSSSPRWPRRPAQPSWSLSPLPATRSASPPAPSSATSSSACKPSCAPPCPTAIWRDSSTSPSPRSCSASRRGAFARRRRPERTLPIRTPPLPHGTSRPR